jgi:hypothetical protein
MRLIIATWFTLCMFMTAAAAAQPYSVDWYTVDGGGGTSTGGTFEVSGTIGQHDAGTALSAGGFEVVGGFWVLSGENGPCNLADFAVPYGTLDFFDLQAFLSAYSAALPSADANGDTIFDFFDVLVFLQAFSDGCP